MEKQLYIIKPEFKEKILRYEDKFRYEGNISLDAEEVTAIIYNPDQYFEEGFPLRDSKDTFKNKKNSELVWVRDPKIGSICKGMLEPKPEIRFSPLFSGESYYYLTILEHEREDLVRMAISEGYTILPMTHPNKLELIREEKLIIKELK